MEVIPAQLARNPFGSKLQSLKATLAESIAQADRGEWHRIDAVFAPLTVDKLFPVEHQIIYYREVQAGIEVLAVLHQRQICLLICHGGAATLPENGWRRR